MDIRRRMNFNLEELLEGCSKPKTTILSSEDIKEHFEEVDRKHKNAVEQFKNGATNVTDIMTPVMGMRHSFFSDPVNDIKKIAENLRKKKALEKDKQFIGKLGRRF
jgi:hypothetical protein